MARTGDLEDVAARSGGYSGADMKGLCDVAKQRAVNREIGSGSEDCVTARDFGAALEKVRPGTTAAQLEELESWRFVRGRPQEGGDAE